MLILQWSISIEIDDETEDSTGNVATENDQQGYDIVQKCIQGNACRVFVLCPESVLLMIGVIFGVFIFVDVAGQVDKLKVDQCKLYLRKHGLRLTGKKDVLIQRIKEHLEYALYPCRSLLYRYGCIYPFPTFLDYYLIFALTIYLLFQYCQWRWRSEVPTIKFYTQL